jgi:signal transduction histidine kinase
MQNAERVESLREGIKAALESEIPDFGQVLALSNELATLDPNQVRFSVDAGHISRLGRELVAREETALSELVKNSYDADASIVELIFEGSDHPGGTLTISDNGTGMNREQLINGFMRLSSAEKARNPLSPKYKRLRAGRKGIGRFAAQRLGSKLTVVTEPEGEKLRLEINIDWNQFVSERDLFSIASDIKELPALGKPGTILLITDLVEAWSDAAINRMYRYIADLLQPFPLSKVRDESKSDPGFHVTIYRERGGEITEVASIDQLVYEHALAVIEGVVDKQGKGYWSINSSLLSLNDAAVAIGPDRQEPSKPYEVLRNAYLRAYYYIYDAAFLPKLQRKTIRELANSRAGIRVYRNGFRVLPYGEPLNDWLELDASSGRRLILPPHANINFFGFVELHDPDGYLFEETSSREGLIENEAFHELVDFGSRVLKAAAIKVAEARSRKTRPSQRDWEPERTPTQRLKDAAAQLDDVADQPAGGPTENSSASPPKVTTEPPTNREVLRELVLEIREAVSDQEAREAAHLAEIGMLRVLASLGLTIGEFTHEIRHRLPPLFADARELARIGEADPKTRQVADDLMTNLSTFRTYAAYFDAAISENVRRETIPLEIRDVIRNFVRVVQPAARTYDISVQQPRITGYRLFTCPMHPSEWVSILFNLFTNSRKAIARAGRPGVILISAGRSSGRIYVEFADNGDGIAPDIRERIFDAFFTTSSPAAPGQSPEEEVLGTGLGLKIVRDILESYKGTISLVAPPSEFATCFRVEVPSATAEELEHHAL